MMSKNGRGGGIYRFLTFFFAAAFIITLSLFVLFLIRTPGKVSPADLTAESLKFETALDRVFSEAGISRNAVFKESEEDLSDAGIEWVKFQKSLSLPEEAAEKFADRFRDEAIKRGFEVYTTRYSAGMELSVSFRGAVISGIIISIKPSYRAAIIIDDVGYHKGLGEFIDSGAVFTYAVLPGISHSLARVEELREAGFPYILHMPMEPIGYPGVNPGDPALFSGMNSGDISLKLEEALKSVPGASGINNHMGSAFTSDAVSVRNLMSVLKEKEMFFIDSRTVGNSLAFDAAIAAGIPAAENRVFLDNKDDPEYIRERLEILIKRVIDTGEAVAIGHATRKYTASVIKEFLPKFKEAGIELVPVEELLR